MIVHSNLQVLEGIEWREETDGRKVRGSGKINTWSKQSKNLYIEFKNGHKRYGRRSGEQNRPL